MKKLLIIATLAIVCQFATANAQCLGFRMFVPHIGIGIGIPAPVVPPVVYYGNPYRYYGYPHPVGYYGGYRVAPRGYYGGYRGHGGYYAHRR